jgi:hypothetical protein
MYGGPQPRKRPVDELSDTLRYLQALARRCMARDPDARPTFPEIEDTLEQLEHAANSKAAAVT